MVLRRLQMGFGLAGDAEAAGRTGKAGGADRRPGESKKKNLRKEKDMEAPRVKLLQKHQKKVDGLINELTLLMALASAEGEEVVGQMQADLQRFADAAEQ